MLRPFHFDEGEYYHVFNRGVEKRIIFENNSDKERFQKLLYLCNSERVVHFSELPDIYRGPSIYELERNEPIVSVGAYCLMGTHFHLLFREINSGGISQFMKKLITAYAMYFNIRNRRSGALFESRFRAQHIISDVHLKYLYSYIHLNPAEHIEPNWKDEGIKNLTRTTQYLMGYQYSSFLDYGGIKRPQASILKTTDFPNYFRRQTDFIREILGWLKFQPEKPLPY